MKKYESIVIELESYKEELLYLSKHIIKPNILSDHKKYKLLLNRYNKLDKIVFFYNEYKKKLISLKEAIYMLEHDPDEEMKILAFQEKIKIQNELHLLKKKIDNIINYKSEKKYGKKEDYRDVILEIRSGTGGDEACLFVEDILRMYIMYFKKLKWKYNIINFQKGSKGYKEIVLDIHGEKKDKIYGNLKFESGVHRVQRIPKTESQGRLHTSAITVAVLPKVESVEVNLHISDIKKETFRSSGAGGQHVNKTESAVRLTHLPTKITVECQEERSQHKNFEKAMIVLKSKIYKNKMDKMIKERSIKRKSLISTGDRSVKIRTYNYPNNRVTDHRINKSIHNLFDFMNGNIQNMIDSLKLIENN
ncbi:peptide chain release factor 1 [Blattabacterium cuenoti]|uniref:peptide chain release factor 1 n=1 Tax=Blattabacterium cuenoti TaxID=1653831 RepID=UPI00163BFA0D